jgi:hypothetical protein
MSKSAQVIPESEIWLHSPEVRVTLDRAIAWAEKHPPKESDLSVLERKIRSKTIGPSVGRTTPD